LRQQRDALTAKNAQVQQEVKRLQALVDEKSSETEKEKLYSEELERKCEELTKELQDSKSLLFNIELKIKQCETDMEIEKNNSKVLRAEVDKQRDRADAAVSEQVKAENKARTSTEDYQLLTIKNKQQVEVYETKVNELSGSQGSVEDALRKEFVQQLEQILAERQAQYEDEKNAGIAQLKALYDDKMKGYRESVDQLNQEVEHEKAKVEAVTAEMESTKTKAAESIAVKDSLQRRLQEQQSQIDQMHKKHAVEIAEKVEFIQKLKTTFNRKDKEFDELLDVKIALAMEIKAYRQLIENEEERLGYASPFKKQRTEDPTDHLSITSLDLDRQFIHIRNSTTDPISLDGYKLCSRETKEEFKFPSKIILQPADTITVWVGSNYVNKNNPPKEVVWMSENESIFDGNGDAVFLINPSGQTMSTVEVIPKQPNNDDLE